MHYTTFPEFFKRTIEKNRRTQDWLIHFIFSRTGVDCGVACYAMAADISYAKAAKIVIPKEGFGTSTKKLAELLGGKYTVYRNPRREFMDFKGNGKNMILLTFPDVREQAGHFVVKDSKDVVYDPDNEMMSMDDYLFSDPQYHLVYASVEFPLHKNGKPIEDLPTLF